MTGKTDYFGTVVIPLYNERESLAELYRQLTTVMERTFARHELIFVDDGSTDGSVDVLRELRLDDRRVKIISFRRNYGKSAALSDAFKAARGDIVVTIDADLQDNPEEIPGLVARLEEGRRRRPAGVPLRHCCAASLQQVGKRGGDRLATRHHEQRPLAQQPDSRQRLRRARRESAARLAGMRHSGTTTTARTPSGRRAASSTAPAQPHTSRMRAAGCNHPPGHP